MKAAIHPNYVTAKVVCACGNTFTTLSTKTTINVEVCYKCHPYFTGEHRFVDVKGKVDEFQKRMKVAQVYQAKAKAKKAKKVVKEEKRPKTLRELLSEV